MHRVLNTALVVVAVLVFGAAGYVLMHNDPPSSAGGSPLAPSLTAPPSTPAGSSTANRTDRPVVAFLGDDWTAGEGASAKGKRFTTLLADQLDVVEKNFGGPGSGYAKSGPDDGPYRSRVDAVVAAHPDIVVVTGGRNDRYAALATAADQADKLFQALHDRLPHARLLAVSPWWGDSDLPAQIRRLAGDVESAVTDAGGTYLDLADPIHAHPEFMADAADPNDRGYAAIADVLRPALRAFVQ